MLANSYHHRFSGGDHAFPIFRDPLAAMRLQLIDYSPLLDSLVRRINAWLKKTVICQQDTADHISLTGG